MFMWLQAANNMVVLVGVGECSSANCEFACDRIFQVYLFVYLSSLARKVDPWSVSVAFPCPTHMSLTV